MEEEVCKKGKIYILIIACILVVYQFIGVISAMLTPVKLGTMLCINFRK
jgi:hypothetical protein